MDQETRPGTGVDTSPAAGPHVPPANVSPSVAYFTMEIAVEPDIPTYSGGLGMLAGDSIRAAADLALPMVCVSLVHHEGYFRQQIDPVTGVQHEYPSAWPVGERLELAAARTTIELDGRTVTIAAWIFSVRGLGGHCVPVYFLDTRLDENDPADQSLTDRLYGGDERTRLRQEAILGLGGLAMLEALGHSRLETWHMNEGHSALLTLGLLERFMAHHGRHEPQAQDVDEVRSRCVFTTHTPVPAGHDVFPRALLAEVLGSRLLSLAEQTGGLLDDMLNLTYLGLHFARYVNGVSRRHREVSLGMFPGHAIASITNGVHATTWVAPAFAALYDSMIPHWRQDNRYLRHACVLPLSEIRHAHVASKDALVDHIRQRAGIDLDAAVFTIGFARRATAYKRADLLLFDPERLARIAHRVGPLQILYGGKAHPRDEPGKALIRRVHEVASAMDADVSIHYLEEYDWKLARLYCSGVDLWLNTPLKPNEASGTSGMKAAMNGVPSLSVLDGWWIEGHEEGVTGWAIDDDWAADTSTEAEVRTLYDKLEYIIAPMYYTRPDDYARVQRSSIAFNGSHFNAQRMMSQYLENAYRPRNNA